ncbi:MAG: hypothetical protein SFY96_10780 [Planctomycetota bacterium]|nr:hypothetical protein [Planctomycetota bacterium]
MTTPHESHPGAPREPDAFAVAIERRLDGAMSPDEAAAFDRALAADPALRARFDAVAASAPTLDASVRTGFDAPRGDDLIRRIRAAARERSGTPAEIASEPAPKLVLPSPTRSVARHAWLALAAAVVLAIGAGVWLARESARSRERGVQLIAYYHEQVSLGLTPQWVCTDDANFRVYTQSRFGAPMTFTPPPPGLALIGWTYVRGPMRTPTNAVLMATRDTTPVLVIVEKREYAPRVTPPIDGGLHIHRRDLEHVTLFEISPAAAPSVLDILSEAPAGSGTPTPRSRPAGPAQPGPAQPE